MLCSISGFLYSKFLSDLIPTFVLEGIGILYRRMPKCNSALQTEKFFFNPKFDQNCQISALFRTQNTQKKLGK